MIYSQRQKLLPQQYNRPTLSATQEHHNGLVQCTHVHVVTVVNLSKIFGVRVWKISNNACHHLCIWST